MKALSEPLVYKAMMAVLVPPDHAASVEPQGPLAETVQTAHRAPEVQQAHAEILVPLAL